MKIVLFLFTTIVIVFYIIASMDTQKNISEQKEKKLYGFYSEESISEGNPSAFYRTSDNKLVEVTAVGDSLNPVDDGYLWDDAKFVGEVVEYVNPGKLGKVKIMWAYRNYSK
jgi:hypothetical protein